MDVDVIESENPRRILHKICRAVDGLGICSHDGRDRWDTQGTIFPTLRQTRLFYAQITVRFLVFGRIQLKVFGEWGSGRERRVA